MAERTPTRPRRFAPAALTCGHRSDPEAHRHRSQGACSVCGEPVFGCRPYTRLGIGPGTDGALTHWSCAFYPTKRDGWCRVIDVEILPGGVVRTLSRPGAEAQLHLGGLA